MRNDNHNKETSTKSPNVDRKTSHLTSNSRFGVCVDYEAYDHFLKQSDLSAEDKKKLIDSLWAIVVGFVSLGFEVGPTQNMNRKNDELNNEINEYISSEYASTHLEAEGTHLNKPTTQSDGVEI